MAYTPTQNSLLGGAFALTAGTEFPGLSEKQRSWIYDNTKEEDELSKKQKQYEIYKQVLPTVMATKKADERNIAKQELLYATANEKDESKKKQQEFTLKMADLADEIRTAGLKQGYDASNISDDKLIGELAKTPQNQQLLVNYFNSGDQEILYANGFKERPVKELGADETKVQGTTTIKGTAAAQSPLNMGKAEWLNPLGRIMEIVDNAAQKIPTVTGNKLEQKWIDRVNAITPEERIEFEKKFNRSKFIQIMYGDVDTYIGEAKKTLLDQIMGVGSKGPNVAKIITNIPSSTVKTVSAIGRAITNPVDTLAGLGKIIFTPEGRQLIIDRYGSLENFSETLNNDPVGVASDVLAVVEGGAGIAKTGAKIAGTTKTAARIGEFQKIAGTASDLGLREAIPAGMSKLKQVTQVAENASLLAKVPGAIVKYGEAMTKPLETIKGISKKIPAIDKNKLAERIQASANKLNPSETAKYKSKIGQSIETTMLENDMVGGHQELFDQSVAKSAEAQAKLKTALKVVTEPIQSTLAADSVEHIISSYDRKIPGMDKVIKPFEEMAQRLRDGTATIEDLQKAKTMQAEFQNIFDQYGQVPKGEVEKKLLADNYMEMKNQIEDIAAKYGLDIQQINHDIMKFEGMRRPLGNRLAKDMNLDIFSLTDSILAAGSLAHPVGRGLLVTKKIAGSPGMKSKIASALYKKTGVTGMKPRLLSTNKPNVVSTSFNNPVNSAGTVLNVGVMPVKSSKGLPMKESIPQLKAVVKVPEEPLMAEARKYKSAEEFIDSLPVGGKEGRAVGKGEGYILAERGKNLYDFDADKIKYYFKDGKIPNEITLYRASKSKNLVPGDYLSRNRNVANAFGEDVYTYKISSKDLTYGKGRDDFVFIGDLKNTQNNLKQIREKANKQGLSNIGKTINKNIPQNKVIVKATEEPLMAEARKYKSAEDFYKNKGISILQQGNYEKYLNQSEYKGGPTVKDFIDTIEDFSTAKVVKETYHGKEWYKIVKKDLEYPDNSNRVETLDTNKYVKDYFDYSKQIREEANKSKGLKPKK